MILSIIYSISIFFSMWGTGIIFIRFIPVKRDNKISEFLFSIGIGYVIITNVLLLLGLFYQINKFSILFIYGFSLCISLYVFSKENLIIFFKKIKLIGINNHSLIVAFILLILFLINLIGALAPSTLADSLRHHLAAPKYFLEVGGFPFVPISPWPLPGLLHVLFTEVLFLSDEISCQLITFKFGVLTTILIFIISNQYFGSKAAFYAALIFYSLPLTTELNTGAMTEHAASYLTVLAVWLILIIFEKKLYEKHHLFFISGLLAGCGGATKIWAMLGGPAIFILIIYLCFLNVVNSRKGIIFLFLFCLGYFLILSPWFIRNYIASGNPLWPIGYHFFDTQYWNEIIIQKMANWSRGVESNVFNYITGLWSLTNQSETYTAGYGAITHYLLNPIFLAFLPSIWIFANKSDVVKKNLLYGLFIFIFVVYTIWFWGGYRQPRYLQIIYPFLSIITSYCMVNILRLKNIAISIISRTFLVVSFFMILVLSITINLKYFPVFLNLISKKEYLIKSVSNYSSIDWMNKYLPFKSKILYFGSSGWFYLDHKYIPLYNRSIDYFNIKSPSQLYNALKENGITHVFVEGSPSYNGPTLNDVSTNNISLKDLNINNIFDCNDWLKRDSKSIPFSIFTYYELKPFMLLLGLEFEKKLKLIKILKSRNVSSRLRGTFEEIEDSIYILN